MSSTRDELVILGFEGRWVDMALSLTNGNKNYALEWLLSDEFKLAKQQFAKESVNKNDDKLASEPSKINQLKPNNNNNNNNNDKNDEFEIEYEVGARDLKPQHTLRDIINNNSNHNNKKIENNNNNDDINSDSSESDNEIDNLLNNNIMNNNDNDNDNDIDKNKDKNNDNINNNDDNKNKNDDNKWICRSCDSKNDKNDTKCGVCGTEKPCETDWHCPTCEFVNEQDDMVCQMCLSQKPVNINDIKINKKINPLNNNTWTCPSCQYHNSNTNNCRMCSYDKDKKIDPIAPIADVNDNNSNDNDSNNNNDDDPFDKAINNNNNDNKKDDKNDDKNDKNDENNDEIKQDNDDNNDENDDENNEKNDDKIENKNNNNENNNNKSFVQGGIVDVQDKNDKYDEDELLPKIDQKLKRESQMSQMGINANQINIPEMENNNNIDDDNDLLIGLAKEFNGKPNENAIEKEDNNNDIDIEPIQKNGINNGLVKDNEPKIYPQPIPDENEAPKKKKKIKIKLRVGTTVDIYSSGKQDWIEGTIKEIKGDLICVVYGNKMKWVKKNSRQLRPKPQMVNKIINDNLFKEKNIDNEIKPDPPQGAPPAAFSDVMPSAPSMVSMDNHLVDDPGFKPAPPLFSPPANIKNKYVQPFKPKIEKKEEPASDEFDYDVTFTSSVLGLELYPDKDGNNCVVGRCLSKTSKKHVDPGSIIIRVNDLPVAGLSYDMVRDAVKSASKQPPLTIKFRVKMSNIGKKNQDLGYAQPNNPNERGYLKIKVVAGVELKHRASYCVVQVGSARLSTREVPRNEHPEWQEMLTFKNFRPDKGKIATVQVYDHSTILKDKCIGEATFEVPTLFNKLQRNTLELKSSKKKLAGVIILNSIIVHKTNTIKHLRKY